MKNLKFTKLTIIFAAAGLLVFLIIFFIKPIKILEHYGFGQNIRSSIFSGLSGFSSFVSQLKTIKNLVNENVALKEEKLKLLSQLAINSELEEQNQFLKEVLAFGKPADYKLIEAGVFNLQFTPEGHHLLVNKGFKDGINKGAVVSTSTGVLVGQITKVNDNFSETDIVTDSDFKVTVKLLNSKVTGLARGSLGEGMMLDFISQNEEISNGELVITSGNDLFPAGLIVGTVDTIDSDNGSLFKKIKIKPSFPDMNISRVILLTK